MSRPRSIRLIAFVQLLFAVPLAAQEWIKVTPEMAESHLVKNVAPVYPPFAKAAGIQGPISIHVGISLAGRIGALMEMTGPPSLHQAAKDAVLQYVWKPFEQDGRLVAADTTVTIVFKLEGNVPPPPPPPDISWASFKRFEEFVRREHRDRSGATYKCTACVGSISPEFRQWLAEDLKKQANHMADGSESSPEFLALEAELRNAAAPLPASIEVIEIPIEKPGTHLYLFRTLSNVWCGTGGCSIELIEQDASSIRVVAESFGGGYYIHAHRGSPYPDIFTYSHMSATEGTVAGYSNVAGLWGQLYCGEITLADNGDEKDDVRVCQ